MLKKVARLANLPLTTEEEEEYSGQISKILDYIDQLNEVNASNIEPTFNVTDLSNATREDETEVSLAQNEALQSSCNAKDGYFVTKGVFDNE